MSALSAQDQQEAFIRYTTSGELNRDETYTIELIIDRARMSYDPSYWDDWSERDYAREAHDYKPTFDPAHLAQFSTHTGQRTPPKITQPFSLFPEY